MSFNDILEAVEHLPQDDQTALLEILRQRYIERRRSQLAKEVKAARRQHRAGKSNVGSPAEIAREIMS